MNLGRLFRPWIWRLAFAMLFGCVTPAVHAEECHQPPEHSEAVWQYASDLASATAKQPPDQYGYGILKGEIEPLYLRFPGIRALPMQGRGFVYLIFESAFCRAIFRSYATNTFEATRLLNAHNRILAKDLGVTGRSALPQ